MDRSEVNDDPVVRPSPSSGMEQSVPSLYSGSSSISISPKSSAKSSSKTSSASIGTSSGETFQKPQPLPSKFRTQAQTSSSSGSIPVEAKSHSQSAFYKQTEQDESFGSQELFSNSKTSTPFSNKQKMEFSSLQLSGESVGSQPSYLYAHSKPEISTSPTALKKFTLTSSSSSDKEDPDQSLDVPAWCKVQASHSQESGTSQLEEYGKVRESKHSCAEEEEENNKTVENTFEELTKGNNKLYVNNQADLVMSGGDIFHPITSQHENVEKKNEIILEESQPMSGMNFELSQDFSQCSTNRQGLAAVQEKQTVEQESSEQSSTPFHFSITKQSATTKEEEALPDKMKVCLDERKDKQIAEENKQSFDTPISSEDRQIDTVDISKKLNEILQLHNISMNTLKEIIMKGDDVAGCSKTSDICMVRKQTEKIEDDTSIAGVKEKTSKGNVRFSSPELKEGTDVFALWDDAYYSGVIQRIDEKKFSFKILFDDKTTAIMPAGDVFTQSTFNHGQNVRVKLEDEYYHDGVIMKCSRCSGQLLYEVQIDNTITKVVDRSCICFSAQQREDIEAMKTKVTWDAIVPEETAVTSKVSLNKTSKYVSKKRKRNIEPPSSSSGDAGMQCDSKRRKKSDLHQPCPPKLFEGLSFLITTDFITTDNPHSINLSSTEDEDEINEIDIEEIKLLIKRHGGVVLSKFYGRDIQRVTSCSRDTRSRCRMEDIVKPIICITNRPCTTYKFIYCVVVGLPILYFDWIYQSIAQMKKLPYINYDLPAGRDITGQRIQQNYSQRDPYTPLNLVRIYVHIEGERKASIKELNIILEKAGCERIARSMFITAATRKIPFDLSHVDYILTMCNTVPGILLEKAKELNKQIVTTEWLVQCLLNNSLLDTADSVLFTYQGSTVCSS